MVKEHNVPLRQYRIIKFFNLTKSTEIDYEMDYKCLIIIYYHLYVSHMIK